jgi:hypothetical protein
MGVYRLTVTPAADIAEGDPIYWDNAAGTLGDDATDDLFGVLVEAGGMTLAGGARVVEVRVGRA